MKLVFMDCNGKVETFDTDELIKSRSMSCEIDNYLTGEKAIPFNTDDYVWSVIGEQRLHAERTTK